MPFQPALTRGWATSVHGRRGADLMEYLRTMFSSSLLHIPEDIRNLFYLSTADHVAAVLMVRSAVRGGLVGCSGGRVAD